jgi:nicotinate-nucleotide adenylyltransferase
MSRPPRSLTAIETKLLQSHGGAHSDAPVLPFTATKRMLLLSLDCSMKRLKSPRPVPTLPPHAAGMRIGLLGGTFNPPHDAHRLISVMALKRLKLDRVWWLVTPGNPLKDNAELPSSAERARLAEQLAAHPRIDISMLEEDIGTRYTYDTLAWLKARLPAVRFVWLMGADNLVGFHRWNRWREIADLMPIAVFDRPRSTFTSASAPAAIALSDFRAPEDGASTLANRQAPVWMALHGPRSPLSSTALRHRHLPVRE